MAAFWFLTVAMTAIALAFVVNRYTAHATQYVFIIDVFYPLGLFLLFYSFLTAKRRLFALALLLVLSIKKMPWFR